MIDRCPVLKKQIVGFPFPLCSFLSFGFYSRSLSFTSPKKFVDDQEERSQVQIRKTNTVPCQPLFRYAIQLRF